MVAAASGDSIIFVIVKSHVKVGSPVAVSSKQIRLPVPALTLQQAHSATACWQQCT